ncbi:MAG: MBL fold metallo-hydrolase [Chloroflexi bacterium]|nr:MBL fold metallo-hydrolase [Chloroflexota bacterium]
MTEGLKGHIHQIAKGIFKIGPLPTSYSVQTSPMLVLGDNQVAIVEPGEQGQAPLLLEAIKELGYGLDQVVYVMPTHIHFHHCQGVPTLMKQLPKAKVVLHPRAVPHVVDPTRLVESTLAVWGDKCYGPFEAISENRLIAAEDGQVFKVGGRELEVIHTPGHAPHHTSILDRQTKAMFPGDLGPGGGGTRIKRGRPEILPPVFFMDEQLASLHKVRALKPVVFFSFNAGENYEPDRMMAWLEEDILAIYNICLEGMKKKISYDALSDQVEAYYKKVGVGPPGEETQTRGNKPMAPFGMLAYIKRKFPELELPEGAGGRMRQAADQRTSHR